MTVGQALHRFDADAFCREARPVRQPRGVLVAFAYVHSQVTSDADALVRHYHDFTLGHYRPVEHHLVRAAEIR